MAQALRPPHLEGRLEAAGQHITRSDLFPHPRHFRGRHHAAAIFVVVLLAVVGFRLFPEQDVTVLDGGRSLRVSATFDARQEALEAADLALAPGDRVLFGSGGRFASLAIQRARPVFIEVDGTTFELRTQATTVAGALAEAGIELRPGDRVYLDGKLASARGPLAGFNRNWSVSTIPAPRHDEPGPEPVRLTIQRARPVVVYIEEYRLEISSAADTVAGVLADLGMTVREGDLVRPPLDAPVSAGATIHLARATTVTVILNGEEQQLYTLAETVADVLDVLSVSPGPGDILEPSPETPVEPGMTIVIGLTWTEIEEVEEPIPPPVVYETDPTIPAGTVRVVEGTPGIRLTRYEVTYRNGQEVARSLAPGGGVVTEPVPTRHVTGSRPGAAPNRPTLTAPDYNGAFTRKMTVRATWYNASHGGRPPGDPNYGRTASGVFVDYGICATDPTVIPMGTRFYVPGYGMCLAADTGGAIKGNIIDLGFPESVGDPGWGNQIVEIYILD